MSAKNPGGREETEKPSDASKPAPQPEDVTQRPEVKSLIEKAGAGKKHQPSHGTVVTGGTTAGGGSTKPHDLDTPHKPHSEKPKSDGPA